MRCLREWVSLQLTQLKEIKADISEKFVCFWTKTRGPWFRCSCAWQAPANGVIFLVTCLMLKHTILVFLMQKKKFLLPIKSWILLALLKP